MTPTEMLGEAIKSQDLRLVKRALKPVDIEADRDAAQDSDRTAAMAAIEYWRLGGGIGKAAEKPHQVRRRL